MRFFLSLPRPSLRGLMLSGGWSVGGMVGMLNTAEQSTHLAFGGASRVMTKRFELTFRAGQRYPLVIAHVVIPPSWNASVSIDLILTGDRGCSIYRCE